MPRKAANRHAGIQQVLRGHGSQATEVFRLQNLELSLQEIATIGGFFGGGVAIARWSALQDVQNVHLVAPQRAGFDDLVQQLAGATDERFALLVFIGPGGFAEEHESRRRVSHAKYSLRAGGGQFVATLALSDLGSEHVQGLQPLLASHGMWFSLSFR